MNRKKIRLRNSFKRIMKTKWNALRSKENGSHNKRDQKGIILAMIFLPILVLGGPIPLPAVLKPVGHLSGGESRRFRQLTLLARARVGIVAVPVAQDGSGLFFEAVARLLAVPDGPGQGELASDSVLAHGAQRPPAQLFRLDVVRLEPQRLLENSSIEFL